MSEAMQGSFSVNQDFVFLIFMGMFLVLGIIMVGVGLYGRLKGIPIRDDRWQKQLIRWHVIDAYGAMFPIAAEVKRSWSYVFSYAIIGCGMGIVLETIVEATVSYISTGNLVGDRYVFNGLFSEIGFYLGFVIGYCAGTSFAVWRLRSAAQRVTYADLRQRRLSDYRTALLCWFPIVVIVYLMVVTLILLPDLGQKLQIELLCLPNLTMPNTLWSAGMLPFLMVIVLLMMEAILSRIASFSRLIVTSDPTTARRADDMIRAMILGIVQFGGLAIIGYLGTAQCNLLVNSLWASHFWHIGNRPLFWLVDSLAWITTAPLVLSFLLPACMGHLGGRVTGWPWQMWTRFAS